LAGHRKLIEELRRLKRRGGRSGKDSFDHPPRLSDDIAKSVAGISWLVLNDEDTAASGFNARYHIADKPILPVPYESIFIGLTLVEPSGECGRSKRGRLSSSISGIRESDWWTPVSPRAATYPLAHAARSFRILKPAHITVRLLR
jgi:hypothetical protein